jgi:cation diffusion facilitator family transporter
MKSHKQIRPGNREENEKERIARTSVLAAVFITGMKLVVGLETNSLGILSEAAHSGLDFLAALMTYFAVRIAERPPDRDHPYGHGKIENLSAFGETLLLIITCGWIIYEGVERLWFRSAQVETTVWSFVVVVIAIIVDISRSRALKRVAKKYNSQALEADALHFASDVWSSLVVLLGLIFVAAGYPWVDAVAAILVALLVLFVSYRLGRRTIDALMDRVPEGLYEQVLETLKSVPGVEEVKSIRLRPSGAKVFVDTIIAVRRTTPFQQAHAIMDSIEQAIHARHKEIDIVVHAEPAESTDESVADKIRLIVSHKGLPSPHNLEILNINGRYQVAFDVEYEEGKSFVEAHQQTDDLEREIRREIPSIEHLTIHMEEDQPGPESGSDPTDDEPLKGSIAKVVETNPDVVECTSVQLVGVGERFNVAVQCTIERNRTLEEVHRIVSRLETALYDEFPRIRRVVIHAEPTAG